MTPWLLLDYGEVISLPYDESSLVEIAGLLDARTDDLLEAYWAHRVAYDAGQDASAYWALVAGRPLDADELDRLVEVDLRGWARVDPRMLDLLDEQRAAGVRLALLSNAPHAQADAFDDLGWTRRFEQVFVSARLGLAKPDPAVYAHVVGALDASPDQVTFVDDKRPNVEAAERAGLQGILFSGVDDLRRRLTG